YIIVTPGSLRFLKFALWSLQQRCDLEIVLVANGLNREEYKELKLFCTLQLQCDYIQLQTTRVLSHGSALNILIEEHQQTWFCFCDSDIVSTNPDANDIPSLENIKALSSCDAMFWDDEPVKGVLGRCNQWPDGTPNLSSFFCMYHTQTTKDLMHKYKVGFENIALKMVQSKTIKMLLQKKGFISPNRNLDTGKVLTIAFEKENHSYKHTKISSLLHIGGLSSWMLNGNKALLHAEYHLTDVDLYQLAKKDSWLYNQAAECDPNKTMFFLRRQQRLAAARFCFQLISHYVDKTPKPIHSLTNRDFEIKIDQITATIEQYYSAFQ